MPTPTLEERVVVLERRLGRYRNASLGVGMFILGAVAIGATQQGSTPQVADVLRAKTIEAERIHVVDGKTGETGIALHTLAGSASIDLMSRVHKDDRESETVMTLQTLPPFGGRLEVRSSSVLGAAKETLIVGGCISTETLEVLRPAGEIPKLSEKPTEEAIEAHARAEYPRIILDALGGVGNIVINSEDGKQLLSALGHPKSGGALRLSLGDGGDLVTVGQDDGGSGSLRLWSKDGKELITAGGIKGGHGGAIAVFNKSGEVVCTLGADEYGNGEVGAWDRKGKGRTLVPGP